MPASRLQRLAAESASERSEMPASDDIRYDRLCRTTNSEAFLLSQQDEPIGRIELHFTGSIVYGLLIVEREMPEEQVLDLIEKVDEDLVWSADVPRESRHRLGWSARQQWSSRAARGALFSFLQTTARGPSVSNRSAGRCSASKPTRVSLST